MNINCLSNRITNGEVKKRNKKGFILLAAALTGATTLAVGAVAISGANQMHMLANKANADEKLYINDFSNPQAGGEETYNSTDYYYAQYF